MSTNDTCKEFFPADPDIAGVGIRISVYVTTILLSLVTGAFQTMGSSPEVAAWVISTAGLQGMVLLITAIIQTAQRQLSLYHAFIVFHLLAFLGFQLVPSYIAKDLTEHNSIMIRVIVGAIFTTLASIAYMGWMIYLMVHAPTFGPAELQSCNDRVLYVFFFKSVHVTTKWVRIVVGLFGALPLGIGLPLVGPVLTSVYGIVTLELMIRRNKFIVEDGESSWGFGQVLAMILLIQPVKEIIDAAIMLSDSERSNISSPGFLRASLHLIASAKRLFSPKEPVIGTELELYKV